MKIFCHTDGLLAEKQSNMRGLNKLLTIIGSTIVAGCMPISQYEAWSHLPTPTSWSVNTQWKLIVLDNKANVVASMTLQFTEEKAASCVGGDDWKRVRVSDFRSTNEHFFLANENWSYTVNGKALMMGRNEICDDYYTLRGEITNDSVSGTYASEGPTWEKALGHFYAVPLR